MPTHRQLMASLGGLLCGLLLLGASVRHSARVEAAHRSSRQVAAEAAAVEQLRSAGIMQANTVRQVFGVPGPASCEGTVGQRLEATRKNLEAARAAIHRPDMQAALADVGERVASLDGVVRALLDMDCRRRDLCRLLRQDAGIRARNALESLLLDAGMDADFGRSKKIYRVLGRLRALHTSAGVLAATYSHSSYMAFIRDQESLTELLAGLTEGEDMPTGSLGDVRAEVLRSIAQSHEVVQLAQRSRALLLEDHDTLSAEVDAILERMAGIYYAEGRELDKAAASSPPWPWWALALPLAGAALLPWRRGKGRPVPSRPDVLALEQQGQDMARHCQAASLAARRARAARGQPPECAAAGPRPPGP